MRKTSMTPAASTARKESATQSKDGAQETRQHEPGNDAGRRKFLKTSVAAGVTAAVAPNIFIRRATAAEPVIKIVKWKHFVPAFDNYFADFAENFGKTHKCQVKVDYVPTRDLATAIAADISRRGGHDIFHLNGTGAWLYENMLTDVTDVAGRLSDEFGGWIPEAKSLAYVRDKWLCVPYWYMSFPWIYNKEYFDKVGAEYTDQTTWDDIRKIGAKLKKSGHPIGVGYAQTPDDNDALYPLMLSFKAYMFNESGEIDFKKREILEVLKFGKALYEEAMTPEILSWDDSSNNRFIVSGKGAMICNPISAYRTAAKNNPRVFKNLYIAKPPIGVGGTRVGGARTMAYGIYNFSKEQDLAKEFLYAMVKDSLNGMEASTGYNHPFLNNFFKEPMPVLGYEPKLELLQDYHDYVEFIGYPGPMTRVATAMYAKFIVPTMFAQVATGKSPRAVMAEAEDKLRAI